MTSTTNPLTVVSVFTLKDPSRQSELLELLTTNAGDWLNAIPGFLSATVHAGVDGKHVVNYAQWASPEAVQGMLQHPEAGKHMGQVRELATVEPIRCTVEATFTAR